jgi:hypothetical protein
MRSITHLGFGLLVIGGLVLAGSSGAFDSMRADRGVGIETADDDRALLTLETREPVELSEGEFVCEGLFCYRGYRRYDVDIVTIRDRTAPPALPINDETVSLQAEAGGNPSLEDWTLATAGDGYVVEGAFRCTAPFGNQRRDNATLTFDIETSDGEITISLDRELTVQCA